MSRFERDQNEPIDSPVEPARDAPTTIQPSSEADESAAHIAELVRRTTEANGKPGPSFVARPDVTMAQAAPTPTRQITTPDGPPISTPDAPPIARPDEVTSRPVMWHPSWPAMLHPSRLMMRATPRRLMATAGVLVVLLIAGGLALSQSRSSVAGTPLAPTVEKVAPAGYLVKVTDVITDCAGHSRGKAQASFKAENCLKATRTLATGEVNGRPVLFVVSRIEMATGEAAASVKQVLDGSGTGNLNDLLRDGKTYQGAPAKMPISGYASLQAGTVLTVAEAGFIDEGRSSNTDPALRSAAAEVAAMLPAQS